MNDKPYLYQMVVFLRFMIVGSLVLRLKLAEAILKPLLRIRSISVVSGSGCRVKLRKVANCIFLNWWL